MILERMSTVRHALPVVGTAPADAACCAPLDQAPLSQAEAEETTRRLAAHEGIFCGISAGGACAVALRIAHEVEQAVIVFIVCDRGDRYLSTGVFPG